MIVLLSILLKRSVSDDIDRRFDNLSESHHQSQVNCELTADVRSMVVVLIGRRSRDVIGRLSVKP